MNNQKLLQLKMSGAFLLSLMLALPVFAQDEAEGEAPSPNQVLIKNVNIFDGFDDRLQDGMDVLVEENFNAIALAVFGGVREALLGDSIERVS